VPNDSFEEKVEKKLWKNYFKKRSKENEEKLFLFYRRWVEYLYSRVIQKGSWRSGSKHSVPRYYEEFLPTAYLALVKAIRLFRKDGGASFQTYASKWIQNEVYNAWFPFFRHGRQGLKKFFFVGDLLDGQERFDKSYETYPEMNLVIEEVKERLEIALKAWGYSDEEWKMFYYQIFKDMSLKEIAEQTDYSIQKVSMTLAHIKKDIKDEFGDEYSGLLNHH